MRGRLSFMLEIKNLTVKYRFGARALSNISLNAETGEILCVLGGEESGKTTFLKTVAGLLRPSEGEICLDGENITEKDIKSRNVCLVHEDYGFFENKTLAYNLTYPLIIRDANKSDARKTIEKAAAKYGISDYLEKKVKKLDEKNRLKGAFLRTELRNARVYLFDDPFSSIANLYERGKLFADFLPLIKNLAKKSYVIFATSSIDEALKFNAKTVVLNYGLTEQIGYPSLFVEKPASCFIYNLFHPSAEKYSGFIDKTENGLTLKYNEIIKRLDEKYLLNEVFVGGEAIVCSDGDKTFIYDVQSEKLIYFEEIR